MLALVWAAMRLSGRWFAETAGASEAAAAG